MPVEVVGSAQAGLVVGLLGVYLLVKALHYVCAVLPGDGDAGRFDEAYHAVYRECGTLLVLLAGVGLLGWAQGADLRELGLQVAQVGLLWVCAGAGVVWLGSRQGQEWLRFESHIVRAEDFGRQLEARYEQLFLERRESELHAFVSFLVLRQDFLSPSYLLPLRPRFLRADFSFGLYLARALSRTLARFFSLRLLPLLLALALPLTALLPAALLLFLPLLVLPLAQLSLVHVSRVLAQLVPPVGHPAFVNLRLQLASPRPFEHFDQVLRPPFLASVLPDDPRHSRDSPFKANSQLSPSPHFGEPDTPRAEPAEAAVSSPYARCGVPQSRHESLFCCGRTGVPVLLSVQQLLLLVTLLWTARMLFWEVPRLEGPGWGVLAGAGVLLASGLFLFVQLPLWLVRFAQTTSIQMLRRREVEEEVLREGQLRNCQRSQRIF